MHIFISKKAAGYDKDILITSTGEVQVSNLLDKEYTSNAWHFDEKYYKSIPNLSQLLEKEISLIPKDKNIEWWKKYTNSPRVDILLGKNAFLSNLKAVIEDVNRIIQIDESYTNTFYQNQNLLIDSLQNSFVDYKEVERLEIKDQIGDLKDFKTGMCHVPKYDNWSSSTGRMSILEGPKVLTMNKNNRHVFKSSFGDDGALIGIDYKALEPRVLFTIAGNDASYEDLYTHIANEAGINSIERDVIKVMILSILYGMSRKNFVMKFIETQDIDDIYDKLVLTLGLEKIKENIAKRREFDNENVIKSFYGRTLKCDKSLEVNYYTQSSSVDVACEGFLFFINNFCRYHDIKPLFIIHDELVVDVHKDKYNLLKQQAKEGLLIQSLNTKFPVTTKVFNGRGNTNS